MARHGLAHAYGHVSMRLDGARFCVLPPRPLGLIGASDEATEVGLAGSLPAGVLGEVRIHREIYRTRGDVGAICRVQPPAITALSALGRTPRARHGLGAYFSPQAPYWPSPALVRDDDAAREVAETLGPARAIILKGNGCVTVGATIEEACAHAFYLEDAARVELALLPVTNGSPEGAYELTPEEAKARAVSAGGIYERMWDYLCFGDIEFTPAA